jgi:hypothetical protein
LRTATATRLLLLIVYILRGTGEPPYRSVMENP